MSEFATVFACKTISGASGTAELMPTFPADVMRSLSLLFVAKHNDVPLLKVLVLSAYIIPALAVSVLFVSLPSAHLIPTLPNDSLPVAPLGLAILINLV